MTVPSPAAESTPPASRGSVGCLIATLTVIVALVGGIGYVAWSLFFGPVDPEKRTALPESVAGFSDVCFEGQRSAVFTTAAPYEGTSHPIAVFGDGIHPRWVSFKIGGPAELSPTSPAAVQLVACAEQVDTGDTIKTCDLGGKAVALIQATYEVTLYEARSRSIAGTFTVIGESTTCPVIVTYREGTDPKEYTDITPDQWAKALQPYLTGPPKPFTD